MTKDFELIRLLRQGKPLSTTLNRYRQMWMVENFGRELEVLGAGFRFRGFVLWIVIV